MTKKRWRKLMVALACRIQEDNGKHIDGMTLRFYRDKDITTLKGISSYEEAWKYMKPARDCVGM